MNSLVPRRLYNLLPELYRWRDEQQGKPLEAFLSVLERELHTLEIDMEAMYDNWFIQTCDNWTVPYLADLLGIRDQIVQIDYMPFTQRRRVANTLAYRRRKGTVAVLEQVMWDVTNWHIRAIEFYKLLSATQHLQHLQADQVVSVNLRDDAALAALESPFSLLPRSGDMRSARSPHLQATPDEAGSNPKVTRSNGGRGSGGKYNLHNLGLFFWRIRPYPVNRGFPRKYGSAPCFTFSPTGHDTQLFNRPQSFLALEQRAAAVNMPILLTRAELAADLNAYRKRYNETPVELRPLNTSYYGADRSFNLTDTRKLPLFEHSLLPNLVFLLTRGVISDDLRKLFHENKATLSQDISVRTIESNKRWQLEDSDFGRSYRIEIVDQEGKSDQQIKAYRTRAQIIPSHLISVNLSDWPSLEQLRDIFGDAANPDMVAVDPELGRFAFLSPAANFTMQDIRVDYTYGFSSDIGGGPYTRHHTVPSTWVSFCEILVVSGCQASKSEDVSAQSRVLAADSFDGALALWHRYAETVESITHAASKPRALIRILDNGIYSVDDTTHICLPEGAELSIVAEDGVQPTLLATEEALTIYFQLPVARQGIYLAIAAPPLPDEQALPVVDRKLLLSGLRIVGGLAVGNVGSASINAFDLSIENCTILQGGLNINLAEQDAPALDVSITRSILGPLHLPKTISKFEIVESIVDAQLRSPAATASGDAAQNVAIVAPTTSIRQSTIFGSVQIDGSLLADMVLFTSPVVVKQSDLDKPSLLRYCYLPVGSDVPFCDHCLHEGGLEGECQECQEHIARPVFSSRRYGRPEYAQLSDLSADEILYGVGNIAEIGVFYHLYQPQREANIQIMLEEFLPLGLDANVFHVT